MVTRKELQKRLEKGNIVEVIEDFLDEIDVEHDGVFGDDSIGLIFIKTPHTRDASDKIEESLDISIIELLIRSVIGVLTDEGPFEDHGSGWVYLRYDKL